MHHGRRRRGEGGAAQNVQLPVRGRSLRLGLPRQIDQIGVHGGDVPQRSLRATEYQRQPIVIGGIDERRHAHTFEQVVEAIDAVVFEHVYRRDIQRLCERDVRRHGATISSVEILR